MDHSILPPSSAGIWGTEGGCPGWVAMAQRYPETETTPEALEGEASHEIGEECITSARAGCPVDAAEFVGDVATNGTVFTQEMAEGAQLYADTVLGECAKSPNAPVYVENRVQIPRIHDECFGTPDAFQYVADRAHLKIFDYKFGHGFVSEYKNAQATAYFAGIVDFLGLSASEVSQLQVTIYIVQPRYYGAPSVREWTCRATDLVHMVRGMKESAAIALGENPPTRSGPHCKNCPARHACPTALDAGWQLYEVAGQALPLEYTPPMLGTQLHYVDRALEQLKCLQAGYQAEAHRLIREGKPVPGYLAEPTYGRERWTIDASVAAAMGDALDVDLRKPLEVMTPKQAIKAGIDKNIISGYCTTPRTGVKITPDKHNKAERIFA